MRLNYDGAGKASGVNETLPRETRPEAVHHLRALHERAAGHPWKTQKLVFDVKVYALIRLVSESREAQLRCLHVVLYSQSGIGLGERV